MPRLPAATLPLVLLGGACVGPEIQLDDDGDSEVLTPLASDTAAPEGTLPGLGLGTGRAGPFVDTAAEVGGQQLAGAWSDLRAWDFWTDLVAPSAPWGPTHEAWGFDTRQRVKVRLTADGTPLVDAPVRLEDDDGDTVWAARTGPDGEAELWGGLFTDTFGPYGVTALAGGTILQRPSVSATGAEAEVLDLPGLDPAPAPEAVDVVWLVDTREATAPTRTWLAEALPGLTEGLQATLGDGVPLRQALDTFDDLGAHAGELSEGSDGPEPVGLGLPGRAADGARLGVGLTLAAGHDWQDRARARVVVLVTDALVLDAPALSIVHDATADLAARGVRILAVTTASDPSTGFLARDLALATDGRWVFALDPGRPEVTDLVGPWQPDDLGVRLTEALADLVGG